MTNQLSVVVGVIAGVVVGVVAIVVVEGWVRHMPMDGLSWWERVERRGCLEAG